MARRDSRWLAAGVVAVILGCGGGEPGGQAPSAEAPRAEPPSAAAPAAAPPPAATTSAEAPRGIGVVQSVDTATDTVTISHQPIESLGWPAMTMPFKVAKPELLDGVSVGEKVDFTLDGKDMSAKITELTESH